MIFSTILYLTFQFHTGGNLGTTTSADQVAQLSHQLSPSKMSFLNLPQNEHLILILHAHNPYTAIPVHRSLEPCATLHGLVEF